MVSVLEGGYGRECETPEVNQDDHRVGLTDRSMDMFRESLREHLEAMAEGAAGGRTIDWGRHQSGQGGQSGESGQSGQGAEEQGRAQEMQEGARGQAQGGAQPGPGEAQGEGRAQGKGKAAHHEAHDGGGSSELDELI